MSDDKKLYAERDVIGLGDFYSQNASAMTREGLHNKAYIAAELGWRDREIHRLQARVAHLEYVANLVRNDLLERADSDVDSTRCVKLGWSGWVLLCNAIDADGDRDA